MKIVKSISKNVFAAFSFMFVLTALFAVAPSFAQESPANDVVVTQGNSNDVEYDNAGAQQQNYGYCYKCGYYCGFQGIPMVYSCGMVCKYDWFSDCN